jgi:hypothetical protein
MVEPAFTAGDLESIGQLEAWWLELLCMEGVTVMWRKVVEDGTQNCRETLNKGYGEPLTP